MKFIRLLLVSVVLLFIVVGLVGALLPSHVLVSRAIDIQSSKASIIHYTNNITHWHTWMEGLESANIINTDSMHASIAGTKIVITQIKVAISKSVPSASLKTQYTKERLPNGNLNKTLHGIHGKNWAPS